jgi:catechol 2,3-dioxygenase-like lactoylglutathione lyase family enzyme
MLSQSVVFATIAVSDINKGKEFYGNVLDLEQTDENPGGVTYTCGSGSKLFVYQSPTAGKGEATCAAWEVTDIEAEVSGLQGKGVTFEEYDFPGGTRDGAIHSMGPMKAAWFKDPDGNILSVGSV